jgi:twitching motility protein PilT
MTTLPDLLKTTWEMGGSDLHLSTNSPPQVRVHGELQRLQLPELTAAESKQLVYSVLTDLQKKRFEETLELDFSFGIRGLARFRCNVFNQRGAVGAVYRLIPETIRPFGELGLPAVIGTLADRPRGLVLVTGPTGSGKTTTLYTGLLKLNTVARNVVTVEDPIEYQLGGINQIQVRPQIGLNFASLLRSILRQDPDVIMIGEIRDLETAQIAVQAALTGHLVLSTLHTLDATETVNRIISVVPPHQQKQIRLQLGSVIRAVLSMRLMPRADGLGRVPAVEVLIRTGYVRECIENKEKTSLLRDAIQAGTSQYGMQTFDQSLYGLYRANLITLEEALRRATNPNEFRLKIQGIQSTSDVAQEAMDSVLEMPTDFTPVEEESPFDFSNQVPPAR